VFKDEMMAKRKRYRDTSSGFLLKLRDQLAIVDDADEVNV